jgi:hypothetical protein
MRGVKISYEKVRSIKIDEKENKVYVTSACNNVRPLSYEKWWCNSLSRILEEKGKRAVETEILKEYDSGNFQSSNQNKYEKAKRIMMIVFKEEYNKFDWRVWGETEEQRKIKDSLRNGESFKVLLRKSLDYKSNGEKWIITKEISGSYGNNYEKIKVYAKMCSTCCKWKYTKGEGTKYDFKVLAEDSIYLKYKDIWRVEKYE